MLLFFAVNVFAVPANPKAFTIKQKDGRSLTIKLRGDEKVNWGETLDKYTIIHNNEGVWVYAILDKEGDLIPSSFIAVNEKERTKQEKEFLRTLPFNLRYSSKQIKEKREAFTKSSFSHKATTIGTVHQVVILVAFSNKSFTFPASNFDNMCNEIGYSYNGATGSVKDYYRDNSNGLMNMEIDVLGPYTLSNTSAYYADYSHMYQFVSEALTLADNDIDFTDYLNGNNNVGNVHFVFAGQAQSTTGDPTEIWPHESYVPNSIVKDGVHFSTYSCSSEKKTATTLASIGTMCHEMGHSLGLMDLYDTDYEENGQANDPSVWDVMAGGNYNNDGNTPPYLNGWERSILNWTDNVVLSQESLVYAPAMGDSLVSYQVDLDNNEYYLIENRTRKGWDSFLPGDGLLIFHADKRQLEGTTDFYYNQINANPNNMGFFIEVSTGVPSQTTTAYAPFVGASNQDYFTSNSTPSTHKKDGTIVNKPLTHMHYTNDSVISFRYLSSLAQVKTMGIVAGTIRGTTADVNGLIAYEGTGNIIEKGMYWDLDASLVGVNSNKNISTSNNDSIKTTLTNLPTSTTIHYRAYAITETDTSLASQIMSFTTTDGLPTVLTSNVNSIGNNQATFNGSLVNLGDGNFIEKGFVYSNDPSSMPTIEDNKLVVPYSTQTGAFSATATSLNEQTTYAVRAFATNNFGTKYGTRKIFTTTFPEIENNTISSNQTFCQGGTPEQLVGQAPSGAYGNFTYKWEQKVRNNAWEEATQTNNTKDYEPEYLTDSTFYRRIVFSQNIKDTSNVILINIQNSWGGYVSMPKDTIFTGSSTGTIRLLSYVGTIKNWERKKDEGEWENISRTTSSFSQTLEEEGLYSYRVKIQAGTCPEAYSQEGTIYAAVNSLEKVIDDENIKIYPIPTKDVLNISSSYKYPTQISIINSLGIIIKEETTRIDNKALDVSNLKSGVYTLIINLNDKPFKKTFVINK